RDGHVTGVQTCALPIFQRHVPADLALRDRSIGVLRAFAREKEEVPRSNGVDVGPAGLREGRQLDLELLEACVGRHERSFLVRARSEERRVGKEGSLEWL